MFRFLWILLWKLWITLLIQSVLFTSMVYSYFQCKYLSSLLFTSELAAAWVRNSTGDSLLPEICTVQQSSSCHKYRLFNNAKQHFLRLMHLAKREHLLQVVKLSQSLQILLLSTLFHPGLEVGPGCRLESAELSITESNSPSIPRQKRTKHKRRNFQWNVHEALTIKM